MLIKNTKKRLKLEDLLNNKFLFKEKENKISEKNNKK